MKNNKGFMLAEVIITATVIITALVSLYATYNRTASKFQTRSTYQNIDGNYAIKGMVNHLLKNNQLNTLFQNVQTSTSNISLIKNGNCQQIYNDTYCQKSKDLYSIQNLLVTNYSSEKVRAIKASVTNKTFKNYIDYIAGTSDDKPGYYDFGKKSTYTYLFIVEYKDTNGKLNYSSIGVK